MVSFFDIADGTIMYDAYSTPAWLSRVLLAYTARIAWCCLFSYFISELRRDGLWACPQLSSYSWWGCEYIMYHCWQNYTFNVWEKLMYLSYTTDQPGSSVGRPAGALAWSVFGFFWHGCLLLIGCFVKMTLILEIFHSSNVHVNFFGLGTSTHVCLWSITDHYIIKRHGSHAWYGCWTIKVMVEAEALYDGFTVAGA